MKNKFINGFKICASCKQSQDQSCFYKDKYTISGFRVYCKTCDNKKAAKYNKLHPEQLKKWKSHNKEKMREYKWKKQGIGLSATDYDAKLARQNHKCSICQKLPQKNRLAVDHNHITGQIRGLLCGFCNRYVIGILENYPEYFERAKLYLQEYSYAS